MIKKITSVLYLLLLLFVSIGSLKQQNSLVDWISFLTVWLFTISGLGDAFKLNLGSKFNWQRIWVLSLIYNVVYIFYFDHRYGAQPGSVSSDLLGFLIFTPIIYMSFHYAFSMKPKSAKQKSAENVYYGFNEHLGLRTVDETEKDYKNIVSHILKFESINDSGKLTKATISRYQKHLDKISQSYEYDDSLSYLFCAFYELQACIRMAESDNDAALKFLTEAADIKPHGQNFTSRSAQEWYNNKLEKSAALSSEMYKQSMASRRRYSKRVKIIFWSVVGLIVLLVIASGPIGDEITIKTANPAMVKLAQQSGMSRQGELIFLKTKPQLVSDSQMESDCSANTAANNSDGFIEQGCYDPTSNRIYIREMPSDLYSLEVSTAAYEMLHPVYISIYNSGQGSAIDKSIETNYQEINDSFLNSQVANFAKTEPGAKDLELFSLIGTGYSNISDDLANYYQPYFSNIGDSISANNQVTQLFQSDLSQLTQLNSTLNTDNNDINSTYSNATSAYNDSVSWANAGNAYEDNYNYNIYSQDYNIYTQDITDYNNTVSQYNQVLQDYNNLISEYNGQQFNQASPLQTQQQQSQ
jgi:hypothetical protein